MPDSSIPLGLFAHNAALHANESSGMRLGFDLVQISQMAHSIRLFGDAFRHRLFTFEELDHAHQGGCWCMESLAARFAAKEAVIKALKLGEAGIDWREIEVLQLPDGECRVLLHGRVASLAWAIGVTELVLSMSHDGDYAGAVVTALGHQPQPALALAGLH